MASWKYYFILIASSVMTGCISLAAVGQSGGDLLGMSHRVDSVNSAYRLPDQNVVIFVTGRLTEKEDVSDFSLLIPYTEIQKRNQGVLRVNGRYDAQTKYQAVIGPPSSYIQDGWQSIPVQLITTNTELESRFFRQSETTPAVYVHPLGDNRKDVAGQRKQFGNVEIYYVVPTELNEPLHWEIVAKAEPIEKKRNYMWLPVTVPLDIVTLPAQAIWGALFAVGMAGEAVGNSH